MTWPEQLSCSQQWIKLSVYWVTQDVCSCLITTQCLLYSILYLGGKNTYLYHVTSMLWGFLYVAMETCHFFSLHHIHSHTSKNGIHMNKHLILKPTYKISIWCLSPVSRNYIRLCLCKSLVFPEVIHFSLPPEARGPRGWGYFPRHSAFVIVRRYYSFCPICLLVFNGKKETLFLFVFLKPLAQISTTNFVTDN